MTIIVSKFNKAFDKFKPENERAGAQRAPSLVPSVAQPGSESGNVKPLEVERLPGQT